MKKIVFIVPYFGKFNNYFQLYLDSCGKNKKIDFLIYTDDKTKYNFPDNVKVKYISFKEIKEKIQHKFPYKVSLERAYKLCDFRPLYGYIFEEDIQDYDYWGHCDTDMIWGNIEKLLFPILNKKKYDKLFFLGHCTIYKNNKKMREFFYELINNIRVKKVLENKENLSFDEEFKDSINNIFLENKKRIYLKEMEANIYTKSSIFKLTTYDFSQNKYILEKRKNFLIVYDNGNLFGYSQEEKEIKKEEYLYVHLQARKMKVKCENYNFYKIIPNCFEDIYFSSINKENFSKIKKQNINLHYFKLRINNLIKKVRKKICR